MQKRAMRILSLAAAVAATALAGDAAAAPPWVERGLTLPSGDWAFDIGAASVLSTPANAGMNLEMGVGLTSRIELGLRTGLRFGDAIARGEHPDGYARLFDMQTFDLGNEAVANPEVRLRGELVRGEVGEVALEGRVVLPFEPGTDVGLLFGVPIALHLGDRVRLDTGGYVATVAGRRAPVDLSIPLDVWIQITQRFWLGPVSDFVLDTNGNTGALIGFGLGYQITHAIDFKAWAVSPIPDPDFRSVAVAAGLQFRIE
jgi:hypothetical protein